MVQSVCILGRQAALGMAELESLYGASSVAPIAPGVAGIILEHRNVDFMRLGGSTRLATVLAEIPSTNWKEVEAYLIKNVPEHLHYLPDGKLQLGLSVYGFSLTPAKLTASGLTLKKIIKSAGRSVRLVPNQTLELNTAQVVHNHLTGPLGWELLLIKTQHGTLLAQTVAVQDIDSYTLRDRGRPKRDARVGMLPPKLAQIIINLAVGKLPEQIIMYTPEQRRGMSLPNLILDPFCGTGVVLQEALLMGYDVYGYDIEERMVDYTRANMQWLTQKYGVAHGGDTDIHFTLGIGDATTAIYRSVHTSPIDTIACETYLGRPFTEMPSRDILEQTMSDVNGILKKFLINIRDQLAPGSRLCLAMPAWFIGKTPRHLPILGSLTSLGFERVVFQNAANTELIYHREGQIVGRELVTLVRK